MQSYQMDLTQYPPCREKKKQNPKLIMNGGPCLRNVLCRNGVSPARGVQNTEIRQIPKRRIGAFYK